MSSSAELRPPAPADEAGAGPPRSLLADIWASITTDEFAARVLVTASVTLAVGWLGIKEAVGAVIGAQLLTEAVKELVRRRQLSRRRMWLLTLLLLLVQMAQRAWAALRRRLHLMRREGRTAPAGHRGAAIMTAAVSAFTVAAITGPELALGHSLVGHRRTTFFSSAQHHRPPTNSFHGPGPTLTLPTLREAEATGPKGARVVFAATADRGRVHCAPPSGSLFPLGKTKVSCTAVAKAKTRGGFVVVVKDRLPPTLRLPQGIEREVFGSGATVSFVTRARDRVDGDVPVRCVPSSGARFGLGRTPVRCAAVDRRGHRARGQFIVDLRRPPPGTPLFSLPSDPIVEATQPNGSLVTYVASAKDRFGRSLHVGCTPPSGSLFSIGTRTVTCSAAVSGGEEKQASFQVTVRDGTPPTLHLPKPDPVEADSKSGAVVSYTVTASDVVSGSVEVSCTPESGTQLSIGSHPIACSATDGAGNTARNSFTATVFDGAPTITVPADISRPYTNVRGTPVRYPAASARDKVDGDLRPTCTPRSGFPFPVGPTTVNCSVTDSAGNPARGSFTVTILDLVPPALELPDRTVWAPYGASTYRVTFSASAVDAVDGRLPVRCTRRSGSAFRVERTTTVFCHATDSSGNTSRGRFRVTVRESPE